MKRRLLILCGVVLFLATTGVAQDWIQKTSGTTATLEAVWFIDQQHGWAVGDLGSALRTTDGGEIWISFNLTSDDLEDVTFLDANTGLIVGDDGSIFRTTDSGANWSQVASGTDVNLEGVAIGSNGYAYIAGRDGHVLRSTDNGQTWSILATGDDRYRAVFAVGATHAWVVGNQGAMLATADGGATWSSQSTGADSDLHDVFFLDTKTGWVVGQNDVVYKTTDGGSNWALMNSGINVSLESVVFTDASFGMAVGESGRSFHTFDGGNSWMLQQSPVSTELNDLYLHSQSLAWAVGESGAILKRGTAAPSQQVLIAEHPSLGNILTDGDGNTLYFFTKDAFDTSECEGQCKVNWPIFYGENLEIGAGLNADDFGMITRADGDKQTTYKGWPLYYFVNDNAPGDANGEAVGGVWYVAKPDYAIMLVDNQLVGHDGVKYNSNYEPGEEIIQYFVDDYGRTLYIFINDTYETNNFTAADFSNNAVWPIYETANTTAPSVIDESLFSVIDVHGRQQLCYKGWPLYYFGQDNMMRGLNKGVSFPQPGIWPVAQADLPLATGVKKQVNQTLSFEYELAQNYPNPFNPGTTISFALPQAGDVNLTIYNVRGQPVKSMNKQNVEAGVHFMVWNAVDDQGHALSSGLYYYTLKSGDFTSTKRMLLLK